MSLCDVQTLTWSPVEAEPKVKDLTIHRYCGRVSTGWGQGNFGVTPETPLPRVYLDAPIQI